MATAIASSAAASASQMVRDNTLLLLDAPYAPED